MFDVTSADLKRAAAAMGAQAHQPSLAAYSSDLAYAANIVENAQHVSGDLHCATLTSVHVVVALKNRIIHLARELQQNRCIEKAQREHWRQHARADAKTLEEFPLRSQLRDALSQLPPAEAQSSLAANTQTTAAVHSEIEKLMNKLDGYRATVKQKVDTPEAIEHLRSQMENGASEDCPD